MFTLLGGLGETLPLEVLVPVTNIFTSLNARTFVPMFRVKLSLFKHNTHNS